LNTKPQTYQPDLKTDTFFDFDQYINQINYNENVINNIVVKRYVCFRQNDSEMNVSIADNIFSFSLVRDKFSSKSSCIIICSKDNSKILDYCLDKIKQFGIDKDHDILLIDDRSKTDDILKLSDKYNTSYLRIENNNDIFNYAMINNIGAMYCLHKNKELLIFYNNDLWPENKKTLPNLIKQHIKNKASITGCRLLYPTKQEYDNLGNPQHLLKEYFNKLYDTIQHGGIYFYKINNMLMPNHLWRFYSKNNSMAKNNNRCFAVTGAIHIINIKDFFDLRGYNIGMGISFQDIGLCIEACKQNKTVYYIGSECMYHAESLTNVLEKVTSTQDHLSDNLLFQYIYSLDLLNILGYKFQPQ
jgi:GT2 family glycosyltransferase